MQPSTLSQAAAAAAPSEGAAASGGSAEQQSASEYVPESESASDSYGSLAPEEQVDSGMHVSESESDGAEQVQQRRGRGRHRLGGRGNSAAAPSAPAVTGTAEAEAAATAAGAGGHGASNRQEALHAPYSNLLWCDSAVHNRRFAVSKQLCTDIANVSRAAGMPVQVTVHVYASSWDVQQHIRCKLQLDVSAGNPRAERQGRDTAVNSAPVKQFKPCKATLKLQGLQFRIMQLQPQHELETSWQYLESNPHTLVLQERVAGADPPHFMVHLKPGQPGSPRNQYAHRISRAGEAPGLQVAPGSVTEISNAAAQLQVTRISQDRTVPYIPKVLSCSQLPPDAIYPIQGVTLTVVGQGQWQVNLRHTCNTQVAVQLGRHHPLSAFLGRSISKMVLSQDKQLTITLADTTAAAAATPHGAGSLPQALPQAAAGAAAAAAETGEAPTGAAAAVGAAALSPNAALQITPALARQGQLPSEATTAAGSRPPAAAEKRLSSLAGPSTPTAAQAVAAATAGAGGQPQPVLPVKRRAGRTAEPAADSGKQQVDGGSTVAAMAAAATGMAAVAAAAAAGGGSQHKSAARKKAKHAALAAAAVSHAAGIQIAAAAAAGPPQPPVTPVLVKVEAPEVMDLTADGDDNATTLAAAAAAAAATGSCSGRLPAGLRLASVSSLTAIEDELLKLMTNGLMLLLPAEQYAQMVVQLRQLFDSDEGIAVDVAVLQRKYKYVQAAVMGGQVGAVVKELHALIRACRG